MLYAIVAVIALILDQAVKYWTTANIVLNVGSKELIPGFVHLTNIHNTGAAFSFMEGARWFFVILCIVFVAAIIVLLAKNVINTPLARWMAVIVMAGAVGNCIDRIICGYVVDMFEFDFLIFGGAFPVFNIADIFITVGGIAFCLCILFEKEPAPASAESAAPARQAEARTEVKGEAKKPRAPLAPRKKTAIPDFPKHEHMPEPSVDPDDPFAEWERRAAAKQAGTAAPVRQAEAHTAPAKSAAPTAQSRQPAERAASAQHPERPAPEKSAPAPSAAPQAPAAPAPAAKPVSESYDLEDILAEFKDL